MKTRIISLFTMLIITGIATAQEKRDPLLWPFSKTSIWNMPLHNSANYVHATIGPAGAYGMTKDEDHIVFYNPDNPLTSVFEMSGSWGGREPHSNGNILFSVRIPSGYTYYHATDNNCFTLFTDNENFIQTQPMQYIGSHNKWTSKYVWASQNIYDDQGIEGNHGGSKMSGFGGTVRLGELNPGSVIKHALKVNIYCALYAYYSTDEPDGKFGYRWPALAADTGAENPNSGNYYGGSNPEVQMGTLLALKPDFNISSLRTEPARILAKAMQDYGAYIVDNTAWDVYAIETEEGPQGSVVNEVLNNYGISFVTPATRNNQNGANTQTWNWAKDMADIFTNLHAISNNTAATIGGGPTDDWENRRGPMAPDFIERPDSVTGVNVVPSEILLAIGATGQLTATVSPYYASNQEVTWSSDNESVATVDENGLVLAIAEGTTIITATTQQNNLSASCTVNVTMYGGHTPIPAKIEAEDYSDMKGVQIESTTDEGGGLHVSNIGKGDWMDYKIHVPETDKYSVDLRLASPFSSRQIEILLDNNIAATVDVPNTGSWQTWQTVSATMNIDAGFKILRVHSSVGGGNNLSLNWLEIRTADETNVTADLNVSGDIIVSPNPARVGEPLKIQFDDNIQGYSLLIRDIAGKIVYSDKVLDGKTEFAINSRGMYFISVNTQDHTVIRAVKLIVI